MKIQLDRLTGTILGLLHAAVIGWLFMRLVNPWDAIGQLGVLTLTSCLIGYYLGSYAQQLREASIRDFLTGVYNRRYFAEQFCSYADRCVRGAQPLSLAMLDLDNFKLHNDTHGHDEGDRVLVKVAHIMSAWPTAKLVCRWGGEEFLMLFPGLSGNQARKECDSLRRKIAGEGLTVSIGLATYMGSHPNLPDLARKADTALYASKKLRNTTTEYRNRNASVR